MVAIKGIAAVPGLVIGTVRVLPATDEGEQLLGYVKGSSDEEESRYRLALIACEQEIVLAIEEAKNNARREQAEIMESHLSILSDPLLEESTVTRIGQGVAAPHAVKEAAAEIAELFTGLEDAYLRERAADVRDVSNRIVNALLGVKPSEFHAPGTILCAPEILPSVVANLPNDGVVGLIVGQGSLTSHAVIMAKARGLTTLAGIGEQIQHFMDGATVVLDATNGQAIVNPTLEVLSEYGAKIKHEQDKLAHYVAGAHVPAQTRDGKRIIVAANIGLPEEIVTAVKNGCEGVGLLRTEFVFMGRESMPSEQEQFEAYKFVIERCQGHLCVIRTLDIGGDKPLPYLAIEKEENPFLGFRAIRVCLQRTDIFLAQMRAILRASAFGRAAIMLPMIVNVNEIVQAKALLAQARAELIERGEVFASDIPLGIMVETPAAALMAFELAKECDFFSIGTNDLVQYTLAADRGNQSVSYLSDHFHPAVLRLIAMTAQAAHAHKIWVGVCGEMAGDPLATELLVSLGIDELSMSSPAIPEIKHIVSGSQSNDALARCILTAESAASVRDRLRK